MKKSDTRLLLPLFLLALLSVLILRDFTPSNELRYLSIADEALRDGHLFAFTNQEEPYADKPPLYLWLVMLGRILFGEHRMAFLSLLSAIPACVILGTMDRWSKTALDERSRSTALLMLMTCGLFLGLAVFVRMDMLMCMFITLALHSFWIMYTGSERSRRHRWLFPVYTWLALFTKGPVGLLVPVLSVAVFLIVRRQARRIGRYLGWRTWGIIAAGCALWFTIVRIEGGAEYLNNLLFHQTLDRAVDAFHHKEPVWYYLGSMWYSLAPWSLLVIGVLAAAAIRRMLLTDLERFFLTVIATTLGMLSAFSSKLAVYLAPTFPFFIYLAVSLARCMPVAGWMKIALAVPATVWTAALPAALLLRNHPEAPESIWCLIAAALLSATGLAALRFLWNARDLGRPIHLLAAGLLLAVFSGGMALPELNVRLGYGTLCREAARIAQTEGLANYYTWDIRRPESMDVFLGKDVTQINSGNAKTETQAGGILMLPERGLKNDAAMQRFVADKRRHTVGDYLLVEVPPAPYPDESGTHRPDVPHPEVMH